MTPTHRSPVSRWLHKFWQLFDARNKEFIRDRSALGWNFLFPVIVVLGFGFAFKTENQKLFKVGVEGADAPVAAFVGTDYLQYVRFDSLEMGLERLRHQQIDFLVSERASPPRYWMNSTSPKGHLLERVLFGSGAAGAGSGAAGAGSGTMTGSTSPAGAYEKGAVEGRETRYVDWLVSGLLGMNMMFSALFGVGYVIVRYRKSGVLKRLKATPITAFDFLLAQVASRMVLIVGSTVVVFVGTNLLLKFQMLGSYFDLFLVLCAGSVCLISLGLLVAARVRSEEFAGGLLNLISWPMMFLSGVWFSLEGSAPWVRKVAQLFPLTPMIDAGRAIMTEGATLSQVAPQLGWLAAMTVVFLGLGSWLFRWD